MFDILALQEIQCGPTDTQKLVVPGYRILPFYRKKSSNNRYFGGTLLFIKNHIRDGITIIDNFEGDKIWVKLKMNFFNLEKDVYLCFLYAAPSTSPYTRGLSYDIFQKIEEDISLYSASGNIMLAGDLNAKTNTGNDFVSDTFDKHSPINDIDDYTFDYPLLRRNLDTHAIDAQGKNFLELCKNSRIRILNGRTSGDRLGNFTRYPTSLRESPSTIDYVATDCNFQKKIKSFITLPHLGLSDHECLCVSINTKFSGKKNAEEIPIVKDTFRKCVDSVVFLRRLQSPAGRESINSFINVYSMSEETSIDEMCLDFVSLVTSLSKPNSRYAHKNKQRKKNDKKYPPWYSIDCRHLKSALNRAERAFRKNLFDKAAQVELFNAKKRFKKACKAAERKSRGFLTAKLLHIENKRPKEFWELIKKMRNWGKTGKDVDSPIHPCEWFSHFQSLLNEGSETATDIQNKLEALENEPVFSELDFMITLKDIERAMQRINKNATPGPDKLSGKLILTGKEELMPVLKIVLNKMFTYARQPDLWTHNYLITIFKKGECWDPDNYRGIAVGSCIVKLFSLILLDRLELRTTLSHPISENQIGFKKGHRTADHIFVIKSIVNKIVTNEKKKLFVAFIDFRKAYDKVNRTLLFLKLQKMGIKGLFYENIKALYNPISYLVKVRGGHLQPIPSRLGLKQGCVLSPLLFNLYIDDMKNIFDASCDPVYALQEPISHLLYADDLALMSTSETGLNNCLSKLKHFCDTWKLEVNMKKSKVVIFNPSGRKLCTHKFYFDGREMEVVKSYTYLGLELLSSGSFWLAKASLMDKARKAMFPLFSTIPQFQLTCTDAMNLFHSLVKPIALYNAENWAYFSFHQIEKMKRNDCTLLSLITGSEPDKVFQKFIKFILGVKGSCTNVATLGELGEYPLILHGLSSLLTFWHRISNMHNNTLVKKAVDLQAQMGPDKSEWINTIQFLLATLNLDNNFINPSLMGTSAFASLCRNKVRDLFIKQWNVLISGSDLVLGQTNKMRFYKVFKLRFEKEPYLDYVATFNRRSILTKFRCSNHSLEIEKGRHRNIPLENRICPVCKSNVETETHFLQECFLYKDLRTKYFGDNLSNNDWINILQCKDRFTTSKLINFLEKAFILRDRYKAI